MARQTRATSRSSGENGSKVAPRPVIRSTGGEGELSAVSSKSKKIKKPQAFAPDGLLQMRAQLSRMEARIEAVEEELRQEKQKNASLLQQSQMPLHPISAGSCQDNLATASQCSNGKKAKTTSSGGSAGDSLKVQVELKKRGSQGGLERKRSKEEDGEDLPVTPVKRRKQEEENKGDLARVRAGYHSMSGSGGAPNSPARSRGVLSTPTRSRGIRPNSGRLRSAAVAASAAVASVVAGGRRRARRRNGIVSDRQAASVIVRAPPNSPNLMQEGGTTSRPATVGRNEEEKHVCTLRCPASCQGHLRPTEIVVYEGFSTGFELISGNLGVPTTPPPRLQVVKGSPYKVVKGAITLDLEQQVLEEAPARVRMLLNQPKVSRDEALDHGWNPADCSFNLNLKFGDPFTVKRRPVAQSTDCVRGKKSYSRGVHAWGFRWPKGERGTHAVVGVANSEQVLHCVGYRSLVGSGVHSWGWDLGRASAYHGGEGRPYPRPNFSVPDTFTMVLDLESGSLAFKVDNTYLGPAFSGLKGPLYPVISTVWGNSEVSLVYRGSLDPEPLSLQQLAREEINQALDGRSLEDLGLPTRMRRFLLYQA